MGRGKVQLKLIEDKSSRQVTFSKRKNGLMKKARELAVLCDVDLGLLIFSPKGKLYQFTSGESLTNIVDRYQLHLAEEAAVCNSAKEAKQNSLEESKDFWREISLQEIIERQIEGQNIEELNLTQLIHLEKQLESILRQTRHRKTQIMLDAVAALHEKEKQLRQEKEVIQEEIAAAALSRPMIVQGEDDDDDDGEGVEGLNHHKDLLHFF